MIEADRREAVAALRRRLAELGGSSWGGRVAAAPPRSLTLGEVEPDPWADDRRPERAIAGERSGPQPSSRDDDEARRRAALRLGFLPESGVTGTAWVRRITVELAPFIDAAGAAAPVTARQLVALAYHTGAEQPEPPFDATACAVLDIETMGLRGSGAFAFLVGIGSPRESRLEIDQLLLVDPGDEAALLLALLDRLALRRLLVTYNGRSFDLPVLQSRCVLARLAPTTLESLLHADLLGSVRRLFRDRLGACSLRQAELSLLGLVREGDVCAGAEAPEHYRSWLRGGPDRVLEAVVRHNELDLCATMVLAARLAAHLEGRLVEPPHPADRYRLGVHLDRLGVHDAAEVHYRAAVLGRTAPWARHAGHRLAQHLRRGGPSRQSEALQLYASLWRDDPADLRAARALAVLLERQRRLRAAAEVTAAAVEICLGLGDWRLMRLRGAPSAGWKADWARRHDRLQRRLAGRSRRGSPALRSRSPPSARCRPGRRSGPRCR